MIAPDIKSITGVHTKMRESQVTDEVFKHLLIVSANTGSHEPEAVDEKTNWSFVVNYGLGTGFCEAEAGLPAGLPHSRH